MSAPKCKTNNGSRNYFTKETEMAIVAYNNSDDLMEREIIYRTLIQYPLDKLAENIINRFKFPYMDSSFQDVKDQVVSFLVLNLHKYSEDKGKAFSYFSVIAKNYLILHNNNRYKQEKRSVYLSDTINTNTSIEEVMIVDTDIVEVKKDMQEFTKLMLEFWDHNLMIIFKKDRDIQIANAILELFRRAENIENFNKKALYLMIREMTQYETSNITKVVNKMTPYMDRQLEEFRSTGMISDGPEFFTYK